MMKSLVAPIATVLLLSCATMSIAQDFDFPEGEVQHAVIAKEIDWQPCPPGGPADCEIAILEGNPQEEGLFTVRLRLKGVFAVPLHTHPRDERVTVLKGHVSVVFGVDASRDDGKEFGPGDYYVNKRGAVHTVWGEGPTVLQITGIGPWEVHYIEQE